ncbi:hypothetical protein M5K25_019348 [Dendrobium thyrsiflorum]|uniref:Reverse transcriptase zinc-binding domain-containing protein n=1 Tax=Dendrobium thyrsiflorum TaxID=117978 RepID=A0ABD0UFF0_DENTH
MADFRHNYVWHKRYALRFSSYAWLAFKCGLKTADQLARRGIPVNTNCTLCAQAAESHSHLFFECDFSFGILYHLIPQFRTLLLRPNHFQAYNSVDDLNYNGDIHHLFYLMISAAIYYIWRARNDRLFGNCIDCQITVVRKIKRALLFKTMN